MERILQVVTYMGRGGIETMLMNHYRRIDRTKVQFDFLVHRDFRADFDDEIETLGGRIFRIPPMNPASASYRKALSDFFRKHSYSVVHCHLNYMSGVVLVLCAGGVRTIVSNEGKIVSSEKITESQVKRVFERYNAREYYSERYESAYCVYEPNYYQTVTVWYQSEESLAVKLQLARMFGVTNYVLE